MPSEDAEFDNSESNEEDSDLEEANIEGPNNYRRAIQKNINFKKKKTQLYQRRKQEFFKMNG